ncbi:hypothetical protein AB0I53_17145 [Saccharopolyspora sp. NPDC050389]|uniref:hypothetical protein n=1 Tax=Saccharopolyspora sp. NPDC050389 TaxID=3155516 RepID=UPI0034091C25
MDTTTVIARSVDWSATSSKQGSPSANEIEDQPGRLRVNTPWTTEAANSPFLDEGLTATQIPASHPACPL